MLVSFRLFGPLAIAIGCLLWPVALVAQKTAPPGPVIKFGVITADQFARSPTDSTAEAVVLHDIGEASFQVSSNQLWLVSTRHIAIKILKKSAYDRATVALNVRRGRTGQHEYMADLDGRTHNLVNGVVVTDKLTKTDRVTEQASEQVWLEKFTLPNVREGSIIEYKYLIRTPFGISHNPRTWRFQSDIPVLWSEYKIQIPAYFHYKMLMGGYLPLAVNEAKPTTLTLLPGYVGEAALDYRFVVKDAPAFRNEAYITTDEDYLSKIDFELDSYKYPDGTGEDLSVGWEALDRTLLADGDFGGQIKRTGFLGEVAKRLLATQPAGAIDTMARVTAAYDYVRQAVAWDEHSAIWSKSIKQVLENKKGDAADINLLLVALLREMGLEANPVILSTRSNGHLNEAYALIRKFNYVVAQVPVGSRDLLLDATDPYLKPGMLPIHCLNGVGRLVHPTSPRFVSLQPTERDIEVKTAQFTLSDEGEISGQLTHSHGGYSAWSARREFARTGKDKYLDGIKQKRPNWQISQASFTGTDRQASSLNAAYTLQIPEAATLAGDRLYFRPMLTEAHGENRFKEPERNYPVDFGMPIDETFTATIALPSGYVVEELPKPVSLMLPDNGGRFLYQVTAQDGKIQLTNRISLRKTQYLPGEYGPLRELFSQIVAKHAEQVVLKRSPLDPKK